MKKLIAALAILTATVSQAQSVISFGLPSGRVDKWIEAHFAKGQTPPFSFTYGKQSSAQWLKKCQYKSEKLAATDPNTLHYRFTYSNTQDGLQVTCDVNGYTDFGAVDWVLRFTNISNKNTEKIADVRTCDIAFKSARDKDFNIYYANGSEATRADFAPHTKTLHPGDTLRMRPSGGRSSDAAFPFFNMESPSSQQGAVVAVGWTGTWFSNITNNAGLLHLTTGIWRLRTYLLPGESVRSSSLCLLFWQSDNRMTGHNLFRRFLLQHHSRHIDGKPVFYPYFNNFNWGDPSPCQEYTCLTTDFAKAIIQRNKLFGLIQDAFWLDAGWYTQADNWREGKGWYNTVGNWSADESRFPGGLKGIATAVHRTGAKFMVWFEPERVYKGSAWDNSYPQWMLGDASSNKLYNLADSAALDYLCKYIGDFLEHNDIDYYRQDFNMYAENIWKTHDKEGREGITENHYIEGLYKYWDYLLNRFPTLLIDNCASGGRRIDYETVLRSAPLWRTDYHYGEPVGYQCHTYGLEYFLPQHGTGIYSTDRFDSRSGMGSSAVFNWKLTEKKLSYTEMQKVQKECADIRPYYYEDYCPLSGEDSLTSDSIWLAYQLHRPSDHTGYVVAFRRSACPDSTYSVHLSAIDATRDYLVIDLDSKKDTIVSGSTLHDNLLLKLSKPRSSLLLFYERTTDNQKAKAKKK